MDAKAAVDARLIFTFSSPAAGDASFDYPSEDVASFKAGHK
ncbi:hypothetical protein [Candidatus Rhodoblastus alkanivorans]|nr:hypothetical protein [Candidatus Rhodoblastus alkanivorans]